jgi:ParB/RepB/Spo0J family partition protein
MPEVAQQLPASKNLQLVERKHLHPSPWNRKHISEALLETMAQSMRTRLARGEVANQQPIKVRPHPDAKLRAKGDFEIVYGHRRDRGAELAGATVLLAEIADLTNEQVLEEQGLENSGREDEHQLDEAERYERLMAEPYKWSLEMIEAKFGVKPGVVYARRKLLALVPSVRKLFLADKFNASIALYLARIPNKELQEKAAKEVTEGPHGEPVSARDAQRHIQQHYMLRLADAAFDIADEALVAKAGSCMKCPKRTSNQGELFADVGNADLCTDPICFKGKRDAMWIRHVAAAEANGDKVLSDKEAAHVFPSEHSPDINYGTGYIDYATARCMDDPKQRTYQQLLKHQPPKLVLARDRQGNIRELTDERVVRQALKDAGFVFDKKAAKEPTTTPGKKKSAKDVEAEKKQREQIEKERVAQEARKRAVNGIAGALVAVVEKRKPDRALWLLLAREYLAADALEEPFERRAPGLVVADCAARIEKMKDAELIGLVFEGAITIQLKQYERGETKAVRALCERYKVNLKAIEKEAAKPPEVKQGAPAPAKQEQPIKAPTKKVSAGDPGSDCPTCGSKPGTPCKNYKGKNCAPHGDRHSSTYPVKESKPKKKGK